MSLNKFTSPNNTYNFLNPRFRSLAIDNGLDMKTSNISNVNLINGIPFSGLLSAPSANIIYRPGSGPHIPLSNIYPSWTEIKAVLFATAGAVTIFIDQSFGTPIIDSNTDFQSRCIIQGSTTASKPSLIINNGVVLSNLAILRNVILTGAFTSVSPIQFQNESVLFLDQGAVLSYNAPSTVPFIHLSSISTAVLICNLISTLDISLSPGTPIVSLASSSLLIMAFNASQLPNNIVSDDGTGSLQMLFDASINQVTNSGFTGTSNLLLVDDAIGVFYNDTAPLLTASNTQAAIDKLKLAVNINYDDSKLPTLNSTNVQGALDSLKNITGSYCAVSHDFDVPINVIALTSTAPAFLSTVYNTFDSFQNLSPAVYSVQIGPGTYRIYFSISYQNVSNVPFNFGVAITDSLGNINISSNIQLYDNSNNVFISQSMETYITNTNTEQYIQIVGYGTTPPISTVIVYAYNISVQLV